MNQIWFGLIWIDPKESKTQRTPPKKKLFSRLVWTCLDPSSPQNIVFFLRLTTLSSISSRKDLCMDSKRPILF